ncbi:MAG: nicotinamide mononucleotide transporter [Chitinophagales bacterium]|nr:nicotinamide mononucleotide transporter [Chitinophagales bacterium]
MQSITQIFSTNTIAFTLLQYDVSYIELLGTTAGLLSVWWATRNNILTWYIGFVNVIAFLLIFFQVQLYADMLLQVFYLFATAYGLWKWNKNGVQEELKITHIDKRGVLLATAITVLTFSIFYAFTNLLPVVFADQQLKPPAYAFADSILSAASVVTTILIARKRIEAWWLWIFIDFASVAMYLQKGVLFIAVEYGLFGVLAIAGYVQWKRLMESYNTST